MQKFITEIHNSVLQQWNTAQSINTGAIPNSDEVELSKLVINYQPPWFVAILNPEENIVMITYSKVATSGDLPHLLLNYDHMTTKDYFLKSPSRYLLIQLGDIPGSYETEIYDYKGQLVTTKNYSVEQLIQQLQAELDH